MNHDSVIASALKDFRYAREFHQLFPDAEHKIVESRRDFDAGGWQSVYEWHSRAPLHGRYVVWLVIAIEIGTDGSVSMLEEPELHVIEMQKVEKGRLEEGGPKYAMNMFEFEQGAWDHLVENNGDFSSLEFDMITNAPVDRFAKYWRDTR